MNNVRTFGRSNVQTLEHVAALIFLWVLFFWRYFSPIPSARVAFPDGDFTQQFYIFRHIAYGALVAGRLPLWSECFFAGYPFHADPQSQLFYPPVWIVFAALRLGGWGHFPLAALTAEVAAHYLLAALFTYFFLRAEVGRPAAAFVGAVVFAFGGYLAGYPALQSGILETATWLPPILLALRRLAERGRRRDAALASLPLALAFFAGHPQTFLFVFYFSIAYYLYCLSVERRPWLAALTRLGLTLLLTGLIISVQLLPEIEYLRLSSRAQLDYAAASAGFPPQEIAQIVLTGLAGYWQPLYVGLLPLALIFIGLGRRTPPFHPPPSTAFWLAAALVALVLSFGSHLAGYALAYWLVPGYRLFRGQERLAVVVSFSLSALSACGAAFFFAPLSRLGRRTVSAAARITLALLPLAIAVLIASLLMTRSGIKLNDPGDMPNRAGLMVIALLLAAVVLSARVRLPALRRRLPYVAAAVIALDLFSLNRPQIAAPDFEPYPYLPILDPLRADTGWFRFQEDARLKGHSGCAYGLNEIGGISPIKLAGYGDVMDYPPEIVRWKLMGVKYVVTWREDFNTREGERPPATRVAEGDSPGGRALVYRLDGFEPRRVFLVHSALAARTAEEQIAALSAPGFDPFAEAVVAEPLALSPAVGNESARVEEDEPGHMRIAVQVSAPALLVVSDAWYPGWEARVDGRPARVVPADRFLRAVAIPAGAREVVMDYRPCSLMIGSLLSIVGLLVMAGLLAGSRVPSHPEMLRPAGAPTD